MKKLILAAAMATTVLGGAAIAGQATAPHKHHGNHMLRADANKDGVITRAEAMTAADARFAKLDTDGNGTATSAEMKAKFEAMKAKRMERRAARGDTAKASKLGPDGKPIMRHGRHHGHHGGMMKRIDTNSDGAISRDEMRAQAGQRFDKVDANKDGRIDQAEMQTAQAARKARMQEMRAKWKAHREAQQAPTG